MFPSLNLCFWAAMGLSVYRHVGAALTLEQQLSAFNTPTRRVLSTSQLPPTLRRQYPRYAGFGFEVVDHSSATWSSKYSDFSSIFLTTFEDMFNTGHRFDDIVDHYNNTWYDWLPPSQSPFNATAVGKGADPKSWLAFHYDLLVTIMRFYAQGPPQKWLEGTLNCSVLYPDSAGGELEWTVVGQIQYRTWNYNDSSTTQVTPLVAPVNPVRTS